MNAPEMQKMNRSANNPNTSFPPPCLQVNYRTGKQEHHNFTTLADRPDILNAKQATELASDVSSCQIKLFLKCIYSKYNIIYTVEVGSLHTLRL